MARAKGVTKNKKRSIEEYEHKDKKRANNPPVGLVTPETDPPEPAKKTYAYDPHLDPQLVWAGKAERMSFEVPTVSLHVHERIDPRTIIEAVRKRNGNGRPVQGSLFETREENPPLREAIDFYRHPHNWSNRMIAGDSLLVMNSLLEKEGMAGQVQMIYIDPPYGIKYGSNFQPFVNKRDVKDGKDEDLTQEPEMIRAFRDTWELGIHSYLSYLRDRLWLAKELLHESGSCFVQISDENVHLVRGLMDEVFGVRNFCNLATFRKTGSIASTLLGSTVDYLVWYAKDKPRSKYHQLFLAREMGDPSLDRYDYVEAETGEPARLPASAIRGDTPIPAGRRYRLTTLLSDGDPSEPRAFEFEGESFPLRHGKHWKTDPETGGRKLIQAQRIVRQGKTLWYKRYVEDLPVLPLDDRWESIQIGQELLYVVQTAPLVLERCLLMTTDPGDLVFDPTCGSGTTAYVAEQWGRRWITCDTSRVAITLAKQRLMTALYDYYELAHPEEGVGSGFKYKTVPHVTLKSIANNPEIRESMTRAQIDAAIAKYAEQETLYDQPFVDKSRARVSGPFTVEAVPAPTVKAISEISSGPNAEMLRSAQHDTPNIGKPEGEATQIRLDGTTAPQQIRLAGAAGSAPTPDAGIARSGETLRQSEWRDVLLKGGVRGKGGQTIDFSRVEPLGGARWLHADAETKGVKPERVAISFGPEYAPLEQRQVELAWEEARQLSPRPSILLFVYTDIDPEAGKDIAELTPAKAGMTFLAAKIDADVWTKDLKKKARTSHSVWLVGQPDVELRRVSGAWENQMLRGVHPERNTEILRFAQDDSERAQHDSPAAERDNPVTLSEAKGLAPNEGPVRYEVEVRGFDYFNTQTGTIESGDTSKIAVWLLDTDYDGRSLYPRQVFFPMADEDEGWARLAKNLKAEIDPELIQAYRGTVSLPFEPGKHKRIAVKIVDDRGIESLRIIEVR